MRLLLFLSLFFVISGCVAENGNGILDFQETYFEISSRAVTISLRVMIPEELKVRYVGVAVSASGHPSDDPDALSRREKRTTETKYVFNVYGLEPETSYWFSPYVTYSDGTVVYDDAVHFTTLAAKMLDGHEFVNLGLASGTKWAAFNASLDDGSSHFSVANPTEAMASWQGTWRLPTRQDWEELMADCFWSWDIQNGMQGMLVAGPNGNTIFLPADGYKAQGQLMAYNDYGAYWASEEASASPGSYWSLFFGMDFVYWNPLHQSCGASLRPVSNAAIYDY